jgi:hypothetical protein
MVAFFERNARLFAFPSAAGRCSICARLKFELCPSELTYIRS